jgi:ABC-type sugar transport system substrate-binding protein
VAPVESASPAPSDSPRERSKRVALFLPHEDLFWRDFSAFMGAAAGQLGLELECHLAENNRELMKEQLQAATSGDQPAAVVVFQDFKQAGPDLLRIAEEAGVPAFVVNAAVSAEACGLPRERYAQWIGTMESDGEAAGYSLGQLLAEEAKQRGLLDAEGKIHMIALAGIVSDVSSVARLDGLQRAIAERGDVILHQVVPTDWSRAEGKLKAAELLKRFPSTAVVWAASDPLALGAVESLKAAGRKPGEDALVGGFDWTAEALEAVREGELHTTIGGHFMEGGWVAVLLHDYLAGHDFGGRQVEFHTPMQPITKTNVERFYAAISAAEWDRVDFLALTRPQAGEYMFDPVQTLEQLSD